MDFLNDKTAAILSYAFENNLIPNFVKEASMPDTDEVKDLRDEAFGNPYTREYPCHTSESTVLSAVYASASGEDRDVLNNIYKKASAYDVHRYVNVIYDHFDNQFEKIAAAKEQEETPMVKFALSLVDENGRETAHYNTSTKEDTLLSIKHLEQDFNCGGISPHHMRKIASNIMESAKEFDIAPGYIPHVITKYASKRIPNAAQAFELIGLRKSACENINEYENIIEKLANDLAECNGSEDAMMDIADKAAEELLVLDKVNNIKYAAAQPDPYDIIFNGPTMEEFEKFAAEHVRILNIPVPVADMLNLADDKINTCFSKQASEIISNVKVYLAGETSLQKSANAQNALEALNPEAAKHLLKLLANTGW